eukprot:m.325901 g.325901  ORF g.325901 m.325901 type:complete len:534 (+) comp20391_c0_seq4:289-1890(+)
MAETQDNYASSCTVVKVAPDAPAIKKGRQKSPTPISSTPGSPSKAAGSALATPTLFHTDSKGPLETGNILRGDDLQIKLLEEIGAGSFAKVFRAEEIESGLVVAAKVFTEGDFDLGAHETRQALAEHEYNVVGFLNHENIVRVHGLLLTPTTVCILQELVTHGDLFTAVDAGYGLPADHVVSVIQGVGAALRYLHDPSVNMVHLDIKPENVLLTESGVPKLCDFDTAMKIGSEPSTMRGTPEYQSPESIPGSHDYHVVIESFSVGGGYPVHPALDIWAYTLVGYFIMFGDYAWQRAVPEDEAYDCFVEGRHIEAKPWKSMPAPILQFYNAGLDGRREARATIDELLDMVDSCDFAAQINTMRDLLGRNEAPSDAETVAMKKLNQSDNWKVSVKVVHRTSGATRYEISIVPPRENGHYGRIRVITRYRRLLALHRMSVIQCPPCTTANPDYVRPYATFPKKKRLGRWKINFVELRRADLAQYYQISFLTPAVADFYYEKFLEMQEDIKANGNDVLDRTSSDEVGDGDEDDDVED